MRNILLMPDHHALDSSDLPRPCFVTTQWSVVLAAGGQDSTVAREALEQLCNTYWYPLYAFARRHGCSPADAQDMTQEFFARLLKGNWVAQADQQRGRFRTFLLTAMKHFMANEWHKARAQKRSARQPVISLDDTSAEIQYRSEPASGSTPEALFDRGWALSLLRRVLDQLEAEYRGEGKQAWMEAMRPALSMESGSINYSQIAEKLRVTENAARVAVHRLRQRYRQIIRQAVAATVSSRNEVDEELRYLFEVLANG